MQCANQSGSQFTFGGMHAPTQGLTEKSAALGDVTIYTLPRARLKEHVEELGWIFKLLTRSMRKHYLI